MKAYLDIVSKIINEGTDMSNRTEVDARTISGVLFEHDMQDGFPLLTTKHMYHRAIKVELEFFIAGRTDKKWLQDRKCHIWDEWCTPKKVPYGHDDETKEKMKNERDLGPVYGWQWRHFGAEYKGYDKDYTDEGIDQLANLIEKLKTNPTDRRMIVTAWNPKNIDEMALPACHYGFQVLVRDDKLDLLWNQRSIDTMLGLPYNIASYGLLLHLLAKEAGLEEGMLKGFLANTHIYNNHIEKAKEQLEREPHDLPSIETANFTSIFNWHFQDTRVVNYNSHDPIKLKVAV